MFAVLGAYFRLQEERPQERHVAVADLFPAGARRVAAAEQLCCPVEGREHSLAPSRRSEAGEVDCGWMVSGVLRLCRVSRGRRRRRSRGDPESGCPLRDVLPVHAETLAPDVRSVNPATALA